MCTLGIIKRRMGRNGGVLVELVEGGEIERKEAGVSALSLSLS